MTAWRSALLGTSVLLFGPAFCAAQQVRPLPIGPDAVVPTWQVAGPSPVVTAAGPVSGRITSLTPDPADATGATLLFGTAGGGVWRLTGSSGGAAASLPLTDFVASFGDGSAIASLAIGAVSAQPGNTGVLLAGTGEPGYVPAAHYGGGVLRSIDSGQTWSVIDGTLIGTGGRQVFTGEAFAGFAWESGTGATAGQVVAAVAASGDGGRTGAETLGASVRGLYVSTGAGASWTLATIADTAADGSTQIVQGGETDFAGYYGNAALAVVWNPRRQQFFAAVSGHGLYASPDGTTFTRLASQPVALAQCPTDPGFTADSRCPFAFASLTVEPVSGDMFVWYADAYGVDQGLWADRCQLAGGGCSAAAAFGTQLTPAGGSDGQAQGSALLAVAATGRTDLLLGAARLSGCVLAPGAASCTLVDESSGGCAAGVAGQYRSLTVNASGQVFAGTADGLWRTPDAACAGGSFVNLNNAVGAIAPAIAVAGSATGASEILAGLDGLGSAGTAAQTQAWAQTTPGDSGQAAIDDAGGDWYAQDGAGVSIARCTGGAACANGGFADTIGEAQVGEDAAAEYPPFLLDPAASQQLLLGTCRVWRGPADGSGWTSANAISPLFDRGASDPEGPCTSSDATVDALSAGGPAPNALSSVAYAGISGLTSGGSLEAEAIAGHVFVSRNADSASPAWTDIAISPVTNGGLGGETFNAAQYDISAVALDSHDPSGATVYALVRGFGVPHVYRSTNAGASWTNVSSNLPDAPANAIAIDPNDAQTLYIALDTGVYVTQSVQACASADCWQTFGAGLPTAQAYALAASGGATGMLRVALNGRGVWQLPLASGTVSTQTTYTIMPLSLSFPATQVSTASAAETFTITNTGGLPLQAIALTVSGDFSASTNCLPGPAGTGTSCTITVVFEPTATGTRTGSVTLGANVAGGQIGPLMLTGTGLPPPQIELSPAGTLAFGQVVLGTSSIDGYVLVANVGGTAAALDSITASGDFAVDASQTTCGTSLSAQTGCTIGILFTPTARGPRAGTLTVADTAGTQTLALTGTGVAPASVSVSPVALTFGSTAIGSASAPQAVTITNSGDVSAVLTGVLATGDFTAASSCGTILPGGSFCSVAVTFLPTQNGPRAGTLAISTPFQTLSVALSGTGVGIAKLTLSPSSLNFGGADIGQTVGPLAMTLTNTGSSPATILNIATTTLTQGTDDYAVTSGCSTLAPGDSCTLEITFTPRISGPDPGTLTIQGASAGELVTAALNGSGNELAFASGPEPSASVPAGQIASYALTVDDDGYQGAVSFACTGLPQGAACNSPTNVSLPGSGEFSVTLKVATGSATRGTYPFILVMTGGDTTVQLSLLLTIE